MIWHNLRSLFGGSQTSAVSSEPIDFRELPDVEGRYTMHLAGEEFEGRQAAIKRLTVGQRLLLRREPHNQFDPNAVAVTTLATAGGAMVGYLARNNARWVARLLDDSVRLSVTVAHLFYGDADGTAIDVQIHIDGVPPRGGTAKKLRERRDEAQGRRSD